MIENELRPNWAHICVDMQLLFAPGEDWGLGWLPKVVPRIARLCEVDPARTIFTRFIPARRPGEGQGHWRSYYRRWANLTLEEGGRPLIELVPELSGFAPPADVIDKPVYSPWLGSDLRARLGRAGGRYSVGDRRRDRHVRPVHHSWRDRLGLPDGAGCRRRVQRFRRGAQRHAQPVQQALQPACRDGGGRRVEELVDRLSG